MSKIPNHQAPLPLLREFSSFLVKTIGLYFPEEALPELQKKIEEISHSMGFAKTADCINRLMESPISKEKIAILSEYLTIGETYFFREKNSMITIRDKILPDLIQKRLSMRERYLRIWCAACCSGEEPYSIAIFLHKLIPELAQWDITLLGTDINPIFLKKAIKGEFKK